ncbi:small ubiquitin-related modifier 3-like [Suncus etruscus]|uniref:small ubiquitin-related modifier 3-like n=1 Tax=Suncus etruscus TaxID=109475 RepID=UPI002110A9AE|nr:small ubiquitin-related modifier 3-like [Suncus etruscus]
MAEKALSQDPGQTQSTQDLLQSTQDLLQSTQDQSQSTQSYIQINVSGQDGSIVHFKVKMTTKMDKLMKAYCQRQGFNIENLRFFFDGQPLKPSDTPTSLRMNDNDLIDAFQNQTGGEGSCLALLPVVQ